MSREHPCRVFFGSHPELVRWRTILLACLHTAHCVWCPALQVAGAPAFGFSRLPFLHAFHSYLALAAEYACSDLFAGRPAGALIGCLLGRWPNTRAHPAVAWFAPSVGLPRVQNGNHGHARHRHKHTLNGLPIHKLGLGRLQQAPRRASTACCSRRDCEFLHACLIGRRAMLGTLSQATGRPQPSLLRARPWPRPASRVVQRRSCCRTRPVAPTRALALPAPAAQLAAALHPAAMWPLAGLLAGVSLLALGGFKFMRCVRAASISGVVPCSCAVDGPVDQAAVRRGAPSHTPPTCVMHSIAAGRMQICGCCSSASRPQMPLRTRWCGSWAPAR